MCSCPWCSRGHTGSTEYLCCIFQQAVFVLFAVFIVFFIPLLSCLSQNNIQCQLQPMPSCNSARQEGKTSGAAEDAWYANVLGHSGEKLLLLPAGDSHLFVFDPGSEDKGWAQPRSSITCSSCSHSHKQHLALWLRGRLVDVGVGSPRLHFFPLAAQLHSSRSVT